jgi:restriction system protein
MDGKREIMAMPVPDFQSMMLPFLQFAIDGNERELSEVTEHIAQHFNLTPADREESVPSGNQTRLGNRVGWCRTHLKQAGLIEYVRRGVFRITERGKQVLAQQPDALSLKFLDQFPEHRDWFHREKLEEVSQASVEVQTPEERMEELADDLKQKLAADIIDRLKAMNPFRFERVVLDLLVAMGYGGSRKEAAQVGKGSNDGGVDGLINEDRLGLDRIYVQAKRWQQTVGRPEIQNFVGALAGQHATKGIFITTSDFSSGANDFAKSVPQRVILIDGQRLAELMIEHNIGVSRAFTHEIKRVDSDYFEEE